MFPGSNRSTGLALVIILNELSSVIIVYTVRFWLQPTGGARRIHRIPSALRCCCTLGRLLIKTKKQETNHPASSVITIIATSPLLSPSSSVYGPSPCLVNHGRAKPMSCQPCTGQAHVLSNNYSHIAVVITLIIRVRAQPSLCPFIRTSMYGPHPCLGIATLPISILPLCSPVTLLDSTRRGLRCKISTAEDPCM